LDISLGNLTYHFKRKDDLIEAIHQQLIEERNALLETVQVAPSITNIHAQLHPLMELYEKYRFFYLDILEVMRAYPTLRVDTANISPTRYATSAPLSTILSVRATCFQNRGTGNMIHWLKRSALCLRSGFTAHGAQFRRQFSQRSPRGDVESCISVIDNEGQGRF
jgi:AcrR family transcriptional regulator